MFFMMEIILLVICVLVFGGVIKLIGCIDIIIEIVLKYLRRRGLIVILNVFMCILCNFVVVD